MSPMDHTSSRRSFLLASAAVLGTARLGATQTPAAPSGGPLTAGVVIERIKANVGIPWRAQTVDNIIAGTADTPVRGIASVMMATFDVVKRAHAAGANMVVTHESTFFSHQDNVQRFVDDPTYKAKLDFLTSNGMIVFHLHDHWHGLRPVDGIAAGMTRALGWEKNVDPANFRQFTFPGTPLETFARDIKQKLGIRVMRVIGDPALPINRAAASWGNCSMFPGVPYLNAPGVDVLILGETLEWELVEYVQDTISRGEKKALIILGHVVSEQAGMKYFAEWLTPHVPEVRVSYLDTPEPYWSPDAPVG